MNDKLPRALSAALLPLLFSACSPYTPPALSPAMQPAPGGSRDMTGRIASGGLPAPIRAAPVAQNGPVTVVISIDAFRPDYLGHGDTPNIDALAATGVRTTLRPSFPTLTFPNHTTLVTGLRPEHSGIVANKFYDPARPAEGFDSKTLAASDPFWWTQAEPLWITAERAGIRSGTMFWPGSEAPHDGTRQSDWVRFDPAITTQQRMQGVIDWLARPAAIRPRFVVVYLDDVDRTGHKLGPRAPETLAAVRLVDDAVGQLRRAVAAEGLAANLVVVSDHGMREVDPSHTSRLDRILPPESVRIVSWGPIATIDALPGHEPAVAAALLVRHPHMTCWRHGAFPTRFVYGASPRVAQFGCLADAGGVIVPGEATNHGEHGYDNDDPEMAALLVASGPGIRASARLPARIDNVDFYPFLARLIGVTPRASDGDPRTLAPALAH